MIPYPLPLTTRERLLALAGSMLGQPYRWGGPADDCSGFVQECHLSVGSHPDPAVDFTADALYQHRKARGQLIAIGNVHPGCEAYWLSGERATHVELVLTVAPHLCIGAAGGNAKTEGGDEFLEQIATWLKVPSADRAQWLKDADPVVRAALRTVSSRTVAEQQHARVRIRPLIRPGESRKLMLADPWKEA